MALKREELINGRFAAAADDEPLFVLRSTDPRAPNIVREWARQYHASKIADRVLQNTSIMTLDERNVFEAETNRRLVKYRESLALAEKMEAYSQKLEVKG